MRGFFLGKGKSCLVDENIKLSQSEFGKKFVDVSAEIASGQSAPTIAFCLFTCSR